MHTHTHTHTRTESFGRCIDKQRHHYIEIRVHLLLTLYILIGLFVLQEAAIGYSVSGFTFSYTPRDVMLYALGGKYVDGVCACACA